MGISVKSGGKPKIVVQPAISIDVAMHLSLHRDGEAAPDPKAAPDGKKDPAERRRKPPLLLEGVTVQVEGTKTSVTTDKKGNCKLPVTGLADGDHILVVTPAAKQDSAALVPAGAPQLRSQPSPASLTVPAGVDLAYRGTRVAITVAGGRLKTHPRIELAAHKHARVLKGATATSFELDLKPDWIRDTDATARKEAIDLVVVHHTGGNSMSNDIGTFTSSDKSIHYLLDLDGHVVKMVNDAEVATHAGRSRWNGKESVSQRSIGIEIVNGGLTTAYTDEQQGAIVELVDQILTANAIPRHHVVGHEDIGTGDNNKPNSIVPMTKIGRKGGDPGQMFPWELLEARGIGLLLNGAEPDDATMYAGVFAKGKTRMPQTKGPHVVELRVDLDAIGFSLNNVTSDVFDDHVGAAVFAFQRHFTTLTRRTRAPGEPALTFGIVDIRTAREIKRCTRW